MAYHRHQEARPTTWSSQNPSRDATRANNWNIMRRPRELSRSQRETIRRHPIHLTVSSVRSQPCGVGNQMNELTSFCKLSFISMASTDINLRGVGVRAEGA
eukprot:768814-Hanusia_phi.AAC.3